MWSKVKIVRGVLVLGALSLLVVSCTKPKEVRVSAADKGKQIILAKGQTLVLTLASNPTTGYSWAVLELPAGLEQVGQVEYKASATGGTPVVGSGGMETFRFTAKNAGKGTLRLGYLRIWEKDVEPIDSFVQEVQVQ
jgi:inhibitor of cysteine peptidase